MNKGVKRMANEGWAISEKKMLNRLSSYAKEGWILQDMSLFHFNLVKREPREAIYSMDYQGRIEDREEYLRMFEQAGWNLVCEYAGFFIFSAKPGTVPIHTDRKLLDELRSKERRKAAIILAISFLCTVGFLVLSGAYDFNAVVEAVLFTAGMLSAGVFGMSIVLNWGYYFRKDC